MAHGHLLGQYTQQHVVLEPHVLGVLAAPGRSWECAGYTSHRPNPSWSPRPTFPALPPPCSSPLSSRAAPKAPPAPWLLAAWGQIAQAQSEFYVKMYSRSYLQGAHCWRVSWDTGSQGLSPGLAAGAWPEPGGCGSSRG